MSSRDIDMIFRFYIPFRDGHGAPGGVGVRIHAETLADAIDKANASASEHMQMLSHDADGESVAVYFATDEPFSIDNLDEVECCMDSEGVGRTADQGDKEFESLVDQFVSAHTCEVDE